MNILYDLELFLIPENILSWIALCIFIFILIFSALLFLRLKKMILDNGSDLDSLQNRLENLLSINKEINKNISLFVIISNLVLIIGIGFTFIGIGISLRYTGSLLSVQDFNSTLSILNKVLGLVGYKFQTSVYGFVTYVSINLFFIKGLYNTKGEVEYEIKKLEDYIRKIYINNLLESLSQMPSIIKEFDRVVKRFSLSIKEYEKKSTDVLDNFNQKMEENVAKLGSIKDDINFFLNTVNQGLEDTLKNLNKSMESMLSLTKENSQMLDVSLKRIDTTLNDINYTLNKNLDDMKNINIQYSSNIEANLRKINLFLSKFQSNVETLLRIIAAFEEKTNKGDFY
ncbi:MAG: hypothetical protein QXR31_05050 [Zestosphaera sp.]